MPQDGKIDQENPRSRWVDEYSADLVLAGEPVRLLPVMPGGYHRWGIKRDPITFDTLQEFVRNFLQRLNIGGLVKNLPLNVEHDEGAGKVGSISNMEARQDGLYAWFDLTEEGRELLEGGKFDYLSPEIVWEFEDIITGEAKGPVVVGAALTNYPFFGESTAMYSDGAAAQIAERFSSELPAGTLNSGVGDLISEVTAMVGRYGFELFDLELWGDNPVLAFSRLSYALDKPERVQFFFTLAQCDAQQGEGEAYYPRSAFLFHEGPAGDWKYRVKGYSGHLLQHDRRLVQQAHSDMLDSEPGAVGRHASLFEAFADHTQEETIMPPEGQTEEGAVVSAEDFAAMQERATTLSDQVELLTRQAAAREQQVLDLRHQRVVDQFSREAEQFSALGVGVDEYAGHFAWLQSVDQDGEHLPWFQSVFSTADEALAQSAAFQESGTGEQAPAGNEPFTRIQQLMDAKAKAKGVTLTAGTEAYNDAMSEVMAENPGLYEEYRARLVNGPSEPLVD